MNKLINYQWQKMVKDNQNQQKEIQIQEMEKLLGLAKLPKVERINLLQKELKELKIEQQKHSLISKKWEILNAKIVSIQYLLDGWLAICLICQKDWAEIKLNHGLGYLCRECLVIKGQEYKYQKFEKSLN